MTLVAPNPNIILAQQTDKVGHLLNRLKNALVATGLWEVSGSGDGGALVQNKGQTAGEGGSFDVFASNQNPVYSGTYNEWYNNIGSQARNLSRPYAWIQLKEKNTTRTIQFKRSASGWGADGSYSDTYAMRFAPGGVKTTGATATMAPQPATGTSEWKLMGNDPSAAFSASSPFWSMGMRWWTQMSDVVLQILVSTDARAKGVCPFAFFLVDRQRNAYLGGMFYESLVDADPSDAHPYILRHSDTSYFWGGLLGIPLNEQRGPFNGMQQGGYQEGCYGAQCVPWTFERIWLYNTDSGYPMVFPGATPHPLDASGKWRTYAPRIRIGGGKYVGRSEHLLANLSARDYPSTFSLSSASPRIACGNLLFPWPQNVVPLLGV